MYDTAWIEQELQNRDSVFASLPLVKPLFNESGCDSLAGLAAPVVGTIQQILGGDVGLWFYGGWHDQAAFHLNRTTKGDVRLLPVFLQLADQQPAHQNGDMVIGFASLHRRCAVLIELSRERHSLAVSLRAADNGTLNQIEVACDPPGNRATT